MSFRLALTGTLLTASLALASPSTSDKRGLCFVPNAETPEDNSIWTQPGSSLTWYYNYQSTPSVAYADIPQEDFEFVPMMWGVDTGDPDSTTFLDDVRSLIDSGTNISRVLGFNEPDADVNGGSNVPPRTAARAWVANFEPLAELGVQLGLPGCTGGWGSLPWLKDFLGNCSELISTGDEVRNCTWDFLPVHWYDNFEGLASHIGERLGTWPDAEIWVTEYAYANRNVPEAQDFYTQSAAWFDQEDSIGRYSYFGAFRSEVSNVGPDVVFLNNDGDLTDIGAWYLGLDVDGVDPQSGEGSFAAPRGTPSVVFLGVVASGVILFAGLM